MDTKTSRRRLGATLLLAAAALLLLGACARTTPIVYYQLTALAGGRTPATVLQPAAAVIGIGPIQLPEYLNRPQIVTRQGANRLHLADSRRWAEPLADNIARVLRENLARALGDERVLLYPWGKGAVDHQVAIEIVSFEAGDDGTVQLKATWSLKDRDGKVLLARRSTQQLTLKQPADYDRQVGALSEVLAGFSEEIAAMVEAKTLPPGANA